MTTDLITYLNDKLNQWDILTADVAHEIANAGRPELRDYYVCMMLELQAAREELAAAIAGVMAAHLADNSPSYFVN